jgi:hypothetical protein
VSVYAEAAEMDLERSRHWTRRRAEAEIREGGGTPPLRRMAAALAWD